MLEPRIVGKSFNILAELSSGGFGQTFLAEDLRFPHKPQCVIKQLKTQSDDPKIVDLANRLFEQEVRVLYQLGEHPQIPSLIAHFEEDGEFYLVQEYVEGNTFAQELERGKLYNQAEVIEITTRLLEVLSFVHRQDVIHRDVKPSNLINRKQDANIVLIDFGAVKQVRNQFANPHQQTHGTIAIGSEGYMPVEQLGGHPKFSSDVYAVGMFAIQLLTQVHPTQLRQNQRTGEWIWQDKTSVNPHFAEVLNKMIRYDFRQRFNDAHDAFNTLKYLNLSNQRPYQNSWNHHQIINQSPNAGLTNATYSLPIPAFQENHAATNQFYYQQTNVEPKHLPVNQPVYRPIQPNAMMNQPRQYAPINLSANSSESNLGEIENVTLGALAFDNLWDSMPVRVTTRVFIVIIAVLLVSYLLLTIVNTRMQQSIYTPHSIQSDATKKSVQPQAKQNGFKTLALEKQSKAKTSEDWSGVFDEWKMAEEYYTVAEMSATNPAEKEEMKREKEYCYQQKISASRMVNTNKVKRKPY